jgi:Spy/CpxP family protein refolding chaperone
MRTNMSNNEFSLIDEPAVQKELSLTDEQKAKVKVLCTAFQQASLPAFPGGRAMFGSEETQKAIAEAGAKGEQFSKDKKPELLALLTAEQKTRLSEIVIQAQGFATYLRPDVQEQLGFTPEQTEKLKALENESSTKLRELPRPARGDREREAMEKARKEREAVIRDRTEAVEKLLTPAQQEKFQAMKGKTFDFSALQPGL